MQAIAAISGQTITIVIIFLVVDLYPRGESNSYYRFRKPGLYPLSYGGLLSVVVLYHLFYLVHDGFSVVLIPSDGDGVADELALVCFHEDGEVFLSHGIPRGYIDVYDALVVEGIHVPPVGDESKYFLYVHNSSFFLFVAGVDSNHNGARGVWGGVCTRRFFVKLPASLMK